VVVAWLRGLKPAKQRPFCIKSQSLGWVKPFPDSPGQTIPETVGQTFPKYSITYSIRTKKYKSGVSAEDLLSRLTPYPAALMDHYPVPPQIQQVNFISPLANRPTAPADQFGNLRLFD
jgi:hypothetical protein